MSSFVESRDLCFRANEIDVYRGVDVVHREIPRISKVQTLIGGMIEMKKKALFNGAKKQQKQVNEFEKIARMRENPVNFHEYILCIDCLIEDAQKSPAISMWPALRSIARDLDEKKLLKNRSSEKKLFLEAVVKTIKCRDILKEGLPVGEHPSSWKLF